MTCEPKVRASVEWGDLALPSGIAIALAGTYPMGSLDAYAAQIGAGSLRIALDPAVQPELISGCGLASGAARAPVAVDVEFAPARFQSVTGTLIVWPDSASGWEASLVAELDPARLGLAPDDARGQLDAKLIVRLNALGSRGRILVDLGDDFSFSATWPSDAGDCAGGEQMTPRPDRVEPTLGERFQGWSLALSAEVEDGSRVMLAASLQTDTERETTCVAIEPATLVVNDAQGYVSLRLPVVIDGSEGPAVIRMDDSEGRSMVGWARMRPWFVENVGQLLMSAQSIEWVAVRLVLPLEAPRPDAQLEIRGFEELICNGCLAEDVGCRTTCTEWQDGQVLLQLAP